MYVVPPSQSSDTRGIAGATDGRPPPMVYQTWKGRNIFVFQGRLVFGPDVRSLVLTVFFIAAPVAVFCLFVARKLMNDFSHNLGISTMVIVVAFTLYVLALLLLVSGRDPGIIPRNAHPPKPEGYDRSANVGGGQTPPQRLPHTQDAVVNGGAMVKIKYCDTCMLYRPPRCSHCSICNNCVQRFDHHCPWIGQCIGLRNYRFFFMFVFSTTLLCIYVFGFCWVCIKKIMDAEQTTVWKAMTKTISSVVLIIYTFIAVWFVGGLTVFHLYLIGTNQTTYENFRYRYDKRANPYNMGVVENLKEIFCTSIPPSKNKFRVRVPQEPVLLPRMVDGDFFSPSMGKAVGDIEMGRKPVWGEAEGGLGDFTGHQGNDDGLDNKDVGFDNVSPNYIRTIPVEGKEGHAGVHSRHSSWGSKSGSWEISPDACDLATGVAESNQLGIDNKTGGNQ